MTTLRFCGILCTGDNECLIGNLLTTTTTGAQVAETKLDQVKAALKGNDAQKTKVLKKFIEDFASELDVLVD